MVDVNSLRAEVKKREVAVKRKTQRIQRNTGAKVAGTDYDPRRENANIGKYNAKQLTTYLNQLNSFVDRRTQFGSLSRGAPAPRTAIKAYDYRLRKVREQEREHHERMANQFIKPLGKSVEEFKAGRARNTRNPTVNPVYGALNNVSDVKSAGALFKLTKNLDEKLKRSHLPDKLAEGKEQLLKALDHMGETTFANEVNQLSDDQFDVLWFGTSFAESVFMKYGLETGRAANSKETWQESVINDAYNDIDEFLEWARTDIPEDLGGPKR